MPYDQFTVVNVKGNRQKERFLIIFLDSNLPVHGFLKASLPLTEAALREALKELEQSDDAIEFLIRHARDAHAGPQ
jgi:hypothetical protein